jgi:ABC-type dipeptide/oligopeptide/nickel transport system ATPase component
MMLLRVIDCPAVENTDDTVQIILEDNNTTESFYTESYSSPIYASFHDTLAWYFNLYPQKVTNEKGDSGVIEKLIKFGQSIGDELLGEDFQLIKLTEYIEDQGYQNLQVQIESTRIEFFKELWETTIIHESKYVLSTVVKSYVRQFVQPDFPNDYPELNYKLSVPVAQDKVSKLLQGDEPPIDSGQLSNENNRPLRVLYLVSRPELVDLPFNCSNSINMSLAAITAGSAIDYEVQQLIDWEQLENRIKDKDKPIHIIHYDGPILFEGNTVNIVLQNSTNECSNITVDKLTKIMAINNIGALAIDARIYLKDKQSISAQEGLAEIAKSAHQQGLGNVIGLSQITNPWTSGQCFEAIYSQITKGLSLSQAVVEARKALQSNIETSLMTVQAIAFHPWSLLVHYGKQCVTFFKSAQSLGEPQEYEFFHDKLHGYSSKMLPPLLNNVSDGQALTLINELAVKCPSGKGKIVSVIGEAGTGKSQLAHVASLYFAQKQQIDFGFYFDFSNNNYSSSDMLGMIAPLLELEVSHKERVLDKLKFLNCIFVLDGIPLNDSQANVSLVEFIQKLTSYGHSVIDVGNDVSPLHEFAASKINTQPLSLVEQKVLAVINLRQLNLAEQELTEITEYEGWESLLACLEGHHWLTKNLMSQLRYKKPQELIEQIQEHIINGSNCSKIELFYQWQWSVLAPKWQKLLLLSSEIPGLLLEMLMAASDKRASFEPAKSLFRLLGEENTQFSEGIEIWDSSGFLSRFPHGRTVDSRCLKFLESKRETSFENVDQQQLQLCFSQIICEGIRLLSQHVIKEPNPNISNNLLFNRRHWVPHFERLWFNQDYRGFIGVKNAFDQLLLQAKLENESKDWAFDLLKRSSITQSSDKLNAEEKMSWLTLASGVLAQEGAMQSQCVITGADIWRAWFDTFVTSVDEKQLALFQQVVTFLENFYQRQKNWKQAIEICGEMVTIYTQYGAWQRVITSSKSLARYHVELGEKDQALAIEDKIINEIPYENSPPGFQTQQMMDILLARLSRTETYQAQILLDKLRETEESAKLIDMLDGVQSDIYYQEENYLASLPHYCKIWQRALESNQQPQIEQLKLRLMELEDKIGSSEFNKKFDIEVVEGTIKPKDYAVS